MNSHPIPGGAKRPRGRGIPTRLSSLVLLLQRSPLIKLLPEARVITTSGFSDAVGWTVAAIAGLGAFDTVSGATTVTQSSPAPGVADVPATAGQNLVFAFQLTGTNDTPAVFQLIGTLPTGLRLTGATGSKSDTITGIPTQTGDFSITLKAWENSNFSGHSASGNFRIRVASPPAPTITGHPAGGNFALGQLAKMTVVHTNGFTFTWKKNGTALTTGESVLFSNTGARRYLIPTADPGTTWRTDPAFVDTAWTAVSGGIGYDTNASGTNFVPQIASGGTVATGTTSVMLRMPFQMTSPLALSYLNLKVQCDDGFVAWLNGTEIASQNKPASVLWNSTATADAVDSAAVGFKTFAIDQRLGLLKAGANLLAVQALNRSSGSSDMLFNCELSGGINATNSATLVLAGLRSQDAGSYTVTLNPTNSATSNPAIINLPPSITTQPADASISSGQTAQLSVVAATSPPFTYQWYTGPAGTTTSPVAGATAATFTTPALSATTSYWVRITNSAGSTDSAAATVTVAVPPPVISSDPGSPTIDSGATAQLSVAATGTGPFTYQWYRGISGDTANPVAGATSSDFTTPALTQTTSYWARVTNAGGFVNSRTGIVTVNSLDPYSAWKAAQFPPGAVAGTTDPGADPDRDGRTNQDEYIFGTPPTVSGTGPLLTIIAPAGQQAITFTATKAEGAGYAGRTRLFTIESTSDVTGNSWTAVPGFIDIAGNNQVVNYSPGAASGHKFYRLRVRLAP